MLAEAVDAADLMGFGFGLAERGEEHSGQNGDDGDYHQQLDQGEGESIGAAQGFVGDVCVCEEFHWRIFGF